MRQVAIGHVRDGMELAQDIPNQYPGGVPLLRAGLVLSERLALRLSENSVRAVWVKDQLGEDIEVNIPLPGNIRRAGEAAQATFVKSATKTLHSSAGIPDEVLAQVEAAVHDLTIALADCPEAQLAFDDLASADSYAHSHSIRVATLGVLLGQRVMRAEGWYDWKRNRRFDHIEERIKPLGMGLLLHDVGYAALPQELLGKEDLTGKEQTQMREHPVLGAAMLPANRVDPLVIGVVRSHHEHFDGSGYPMGKDRDEIHQFARVAAVANVYDATTSERPGHPAQPAHVGVRAILDGAGTLFDPLVVKHFKEIVMPYPAGSPLTLPGGEQGVIIHADPSDPERPVVRYRNAAGSLRQCGMHIVNGEVLEGYREVHFERLGARLAAPR